MKQSMVGLIPVFKFRFSFSVSVYLEYECKSYIMQGFIWSFR